MERLGTRDWANLHPELLEMIAVRLTEIVDRVCFGSVGPQWRSASKSVAHDLPPQLPWLLLPEGRPPELLPWTKGSKDTDIITTARRFVSLSGNRIFVIPLPEPRENRTNNTTFPSPFGRVLAVQGIETLALLNPLTRSSVTLPPLPLTESRRKKGGAFELKKAKVFASNLVAVFFPDGRDLLFCRPGDSSWKRLDFASCYPNSDFVYYKGRFLVVNSGYGNVGVFDADTLQKISQIPIVGGFDSYCEYLVESSDDDLLLVQRPWCQGQKFELFQLDESEGPVKWMKINNMGDNALFVDYVQAVAFDVTGSNGWRGNCIYFLDILPSANHGLTVFNVGTASNVEEGKILPAASKYGLMVFNVGEDRIEELPLLSYASSEYCDWVMWFVPNLC